MTAGHAIPASGADTAYYGNPKIGVQVATAAPGLCPSFPDSTVDSVDQLPDLAGFVIQAKSVDRPSEAPTCTTAPASLSTVVPATDGNCQMDPDGTKTLRLQTTGNDLFDYSVISAPLGWAPDPDFPIPPEFQTYAVACGDTSGTDACAGSPLPVLLFNASNVFNYIGVFRHVTVAVKSSITGKMLAGVTVKLACAVPAGQPSDVCPATSETAASDSQGIASFTDLYAPGVPLTVTEPGLAAPYTGVTTTTTVASPVTAQTTTGAEISAAAAVPDALSVALNAPLATVHRDLRENTSLPIAGLGDDTAGLPALTVTAVGKPAHGTTQLANGTVTYTPARSFVGTDRFTYRAGSGGAPGGTGTVDVTVTRVHVTTPPATRWFHDPLSGADRRAEVPVPSDPSGVTGRLRHTRATFRTHGGSIAVPLDWAYGHTLARGEAVSLSGRSLFAYDSAVLTQGARRELVKLTGALSDVRAVTCQGYTDFGGLVAHEQALSVERALAVCAVVNRDRPRIATTSVGYGGNDPVVVGAGAETSPLNRRVVIVVTRAVAG